MLVQRSSYAHSQLPRNNSQTGSRTRDQSSNNGARGTADQRSNNGTVKTRRGRIYTRHFCTVTAGNLGSGHRDRRCQMIRDTSEYLLSLAALLRKILSSLVRESIKIRSMHEITRQIILFWLLRVSILVSLNSSAFRHSLLQIHFVHKICEQLRFVWQSDYTKIFDTARLWDIRPNLLVFRYVCTIVQFPFTASWTLTALWRNCWIRLPRLSRSFFFYSTASLPLAIRFASAERVTF